jgi:hypothetical protein
MMMKAILTGLAILGAATLGAASLGTATPAAAETWNGFSRSANAAYMADVDAIVVEGDVTRISLAIVPLRGEAGDFSHTIDTYEFRCGQNQWRSPMSVEYGADGTEAGRYPDEGEWTNTREGTVPGILKEIACDGVRANPPTWPSVRAFIEAGRVPY